jgi:ribonuclease-3
MDIDDLESNDINFKSRLFEWAQKYEKDLQFNIIEEKMSDKSRLFTVGAYIDGKIQGKGEGRSKKDAQKNAAKEAYEKLNVAADMAEK